MFLTPGPLAIPLPRSSASLLYSRRPSFVPSSQSVSPRSFSESLLFASSLLPVFLTFSASLSFFFLPPYGFFFSVFLLPSFLSLTPLPSSPPAHSPGLTFPSTQMPGVEKRKARETETPSMEKPQPSDNGALSSDPARPTPSLWGLFCVKFAVKEPMGSSFWKTSTRGSHST